MLKNVKTGAITEMTADGVFIAIGHSPSTELVAGKIKMKPSRLRLDRALFDRDLGAGRVRRRRRHRRHLPPGGDRRGPGLHGGAGSRALPRRTTAQQPAAASRGVIDGNDAASWQQTVEMDWDKLKVFHAAAEAGSFTHAGEQLGLSQSAVSRQVSALEQELSVSLFHRHARGLILTEQGELLYRTAHDVFMKLEAARAKLTDSREKPHGELKVTTTPGIGIHWLTPRLGEFSTCSRHPHHADHHRRGTRPRHARGRRRRSGCASRPSPT